MLESRANMLLSIVVPVYNDLEALPSLFSAIRGVMTSTHHNYEIIVIDDGSVDGTSDALKQTAESDPYVKVLFFSRNFGHQAAITAGLDFASGEAVAVMDADLQDPPELLPEMLSLMDEGYDVVSAQRVTRSGEGMLKLLTAKIFYWLMRKMVDKRVQAEVG